MTGVQTCALPISNKPRCHMLLGSVGLQTLMVCADYYLRSFNNVPPVIQSIFRCQQLSFLRTITRFGFSEFLGFIRNGVEAMFATLGSRKDCCNTAPIVNCEESGSIMNGLPIWGCRRTGSEVNVAPGS